MRHEMRDAGRQTLQSSKPSDAVTSNSTKCRRMRKCRPSQTCTGVLLAVVRTAFLFQATATAASTVVGSGQVHEALATLMVGMKCP